MMSARAYYPKYHARRRLTIYIRAIVRCLTIYHEQASFFNSRCADETCWLAILSWLGSESLRSQWGKRYHLRLHCSSVLTLLICPFCKLLTVVTIWLFPSFDSRITLKRNKYHKTLYLTQFASLMCLVIVHSSVSTKGSTLIRSADRCDQTPIFCLWKRSLSA